MDDLHAILGRLRAKGDCPQTQCDEAQNSGAVSCRALRPVGAGHAQNPGREHLWTYASVKNIPEEESYTGVLVNHRSETNSGKVK